MAIDVAVVLVVRVLGSEECCTYRAREMLNMEFLVYFNIQYMNQYKVD